MPEIIFLAEAEELSELEDGGNPTDHFICMNSQGLDQDLRLQLYALTMNVFRDEAASLEELTVSLTDDGPWVYQISPQLVDKWAYLEEDEVEDICRYWSQTIEAEERLLDSEELTEYLFLLVHFSKNALQDESNLYLFVP